MSRRLFVRSSQFAIVVFGATLAGMLAAGRLAAQEPSVPVDEIIRKFAEKEAQFMAARANYTYTQDVRVQELTAQGGLVGEYHEVMDIYFDEKGKRLIRTTFAPPSTLRNLSMSAEDHANIRDLQPFVMTSNDISKYNLRYKGREKVDEIGCYVFDVRPIKIEKNQRYFEGTIWVDDLELQIVKTFGKPVPDIPAKGNAKENLFPKFETYREQIDGYWFPTFTRTDDTLNFATGPIRIRQIIRYQNYKKFTSDIRITGGGVATDKKTDAPKGK